MQYNAWIIVSIRLDTRRYDKHWTLIEDIDNSKLQEEIVIKPPMDPIMVSWFYLHVHWIEEHARDGSTSSGRRTTENDGLLPLVYLD